MEASKETGCQAPEGPILCVNNCGFFGSATTMNMCSKCHKETILKQEQVKFAASSIESIVNGGTSINPKEPIVSKAVNVLAVPVELKAVPAEAASESPVGQSLEIKPKDGPSRCASCRKRVGLTGFHCRCGHLYCGIHRYSDKHDCQFDYQAAARNEITKANPVVKAEKLGKI